MNLIIDRGNTKIKIAVYDNGAKLLFFKDFESYQTESICRMIDEIRKEYEIDKAILSSVVGGDINFEEYLNGSFPVFIKLDSKTPLPIKNLYKTPETLGKDRLAAVVAVSHIYPDSNVLVFDAGTALTIDFINSKKEYLGGNISPGINTRYRALHEFTSKLPLCNISENFDVLTGTDTESAIIAGVQNGISYEIEGYIKKYKEKYPELKVVFTGGDVFFFEKKLKKSIFADPNLVTKGLNIILEHNVK